MNKWMRWKRKLRLSLELASFVSRWTWSKRRTSRCSDERSYGNFLSWWACNGYHLTSSYWCQGAKSVKRRNNLLLSFWPVFSNRISLHVIHQMAGQNSEVGYLVFLLTFLILLKNRCLENDLFKPPLWLMKTKMMIGVFYRRKDKWKSIHFTWI